MENNNLITVLKDLDNRLEELPDYLAGYTKEFNFGRRLQKCEANGLKTLIEFLYTRIKESSEKKDFRVLVRLVTKYLTSLDITNEFKRHRDYVRQLIICLTNPEKKGKKNSGGRGRIYVTLSKDETAFVKRKPNKEIKQEDKTLSIAQRMLKNGVYG